MKLFAACEQAEAILYRIKRSEDALSTVTIYLALRFGDQQIGYSTYLGILPVLCRVFDHCLIIFMNVFSLGHWCDEADEGGRLATQTSLLLAAASCMPEGEES